MKADDDDNQKVPKLDGRILPLAKEKEMTTTTQKGHCSLYYHFHDEIRKPRMVTVVGAIDGTVFDEHESGACVKEDLSPAVTATVTVVVLVVVVVAAAAAGVIVVVDGWTNDSRGDDDYDGYYDVDEKDDSGNDYHHVSWHDADAILLQKSDFQNRGPPRHHARRPLPILLLLRLLVYLLRNQSSSSGLSTPPTVILECSHPLVERSSLRYHHHVHRKYHFACISRHHGRSSLNQSIAWWWPSKRSEKSRLRRGNH